MTLEVPLTKAAFAVGSLWKLMISLDGFTSHKCDELATQVCAGRSFQLLNWHNNIDCKDKEKFDWVKVCLLEDEYVCWFRFSELINNAFKRESWVPYSLNQEQIQSKIPKVISWVYNVAKNQNKYLWGGTIGPDFDCSGLVQSAFASSGIWLPRDAYQQEKFCENVSFDLDSLPEKLIPGDLIFFGSSDKCTHVGLHIENGFYIHSSGASNGHNGIEIDVLFPFKLGKIASFYRSRFRSAGRVISSYQRGKL